MAKADKEYADLLFHTATKDITELKERIAIIENQSGVPAVPTEAQAAPVLTVTLDDLREMVSTEVTLCLKQVQEQIQIEEAALKKKRAEEYAQKIEQQRKAAEAEGKVFFESSSKWQQQVYQDLSTYYEKLATSLIISYRRIEKIDKRQNEQQSILDAILNQTAPTPPPIEPKPVRIFANLPSGVRAKIKELQNRIKEILHTYFKGSYTFNRGYTIFVIAIYSLLLLIFMLCRISIIPR